MLHQSISLYHYTLFPQVQDDILKLHIQCYIYISVTFKSLQLFSLKFDCSLHPPDSTGLWRIMMLFAAFLATRSGPRRSPVLPFKLRPTQTMQKLLNFTMRCQVHVSYGSDYLVHRLMPFYQIMSYVLHTQQSKHSQIFMVCHVKSVQKFLRLAFFIMTSTGKEQWFSKSRIMLIT